MIDQLFHSPHPELLHHSSHLVRPALKGVLQPTRLVPLGQPRLDSLQLTTLCLGHNIGHLDRLVGKDARKIPFMKASLDNDLRCAPRAITLDPGIRTAVGQELSKRAHCAVPIELAG